MSLEKPQFYVWASNRYTKASGACQYYRLKIPLRYLEALGFSQCYEEIGESPDNDVAAMLTADIDMFYSLGGEGILHQVKTLTAMKDGLRQDGVRHYPPSVIYDLDDNTDFVHPFNSTFAHLGVRTYPYAELISPGETLEWEDHEGKHYPLWEDLVTKGPHNVVFDIARNLHQMKVRHAIIRAVDGATVSTPSLASYFREVIGQPNVYVFPNTVVPEDYEYYDVVRKDPDKVRVLWQGGMSHFIDWYPLKEAVEEVSRRYPQVVWVIYGEKFWSGHSAPQIPESMIEFHPWSAHDAFRIKRGLLTADINLCPLADNPFNRCKSAIKWYEGSLWNKPEVTLAADVEPYREIKDGETGMLYRDAEDFVTKLGVLIESAELRTTLAQASKRWVLDNRTPEKTIPGLFEFYQDVRARKRRNGLMAPATRAEITELAARS